MALIAGFLCLALPGVARADNFFQGYTPQGNLTPGTIVAISRTSTSAVEAAPTSDPNRIYGVVIDPKQATITLERSGQEVFVATTGSYPVKVSTAYGPIVAGDYISISPDAGIGSRATSDQDYVLGQALESFDGTKNVVTTSGASAVGQIMVNINPGKNPILENQLALPGPLKRAGTAIAGHAVSPTRIWASVAIFLVASAISIILLTIGVRSAITAIGRNPLSKHTILMGLFQVATTSVIIFVAGVITVYLLLRI